MPELPLGAWVWIIFALVIGILAGHFGWGRGWSRPEKRFSADYLAGLDFLISEQPDRALDSFLKLMDTHADTLETHFALGSLYRRRGEVERAIRVHRNLLVRGGLPEVHRHQALLALAQDYLRAGLLDRAERLFLEVSAVPRLRGAALRALRGIYERQQDWLQALDVYRLEQAQGTAAPPFVAAHYLCELAAVSIECGDIEQARRRLREARAESGAFARAAVLRAGIAERDGDAALAARLMKWALAENPRLLQAELPKLLRLVPPEAHDALLEQLAARAEARGSTELRRLVFAALAASLAGAAPLRRPIGKVFSEDPRLEALVTAAGSAGGDDALVWVARDIAALLAHAQLYRCEQCGLAGMRFYWQCPGCHAWDSFETCVIISLV
jgi:lipopolysaccharide biosynthesis regulator YciM